MFQEPQEFFVDLVSNASMNDFPDNTLSKFKNRLSSPVGLTGDWAVGVQEIFYPIQLERPKITVKFCLSYAFFDKSLRSAGRDATVQYYNDEDPELLFQKIYDEAERLIISDGITDDDDDAGAEQGNKRRILEVPTLKIENGKVVIRRGASAKCLIFPIFMDKEFLKVLGFTQYEYNEQYQKVVEGHQFDITGTLKPLFGSSSHLLFIYTDIIHDHFVGDCTARVLRVVPLKKEINQNGQMGHVTFTKPYYYPVRLEDLHTISIFLADENGEQIKFSEGRVYISLHFYEAISMYKKVEIKEKGLYPPT